MVPLEDNSLKQLVMRKSWSFSTSKSSCIFLEFEKVGGSIKMRSNLAFDFTNGNLPIENNKEIYNYFNKNPNYDKIKFRMRRKYSSRLSQYLCSIV